MLTVCLLVVEDVFLNVWFGRYRENGQEYAITKQDYKQKSMKITIIIGKSFNKL